MHASSVSGMKNFAGAYEKQSAVASRTNNMLAFRKFVFEWDDSHDVGRVGALATCPVGYKMVANREALQPPNRTEGFNGAFLNFISDMRKAPVIQIKQALQS